MVLSKTRILSALAAWLAMQTFCLIMPGYFAVQQSFLPLSGSIAWAKLGRKGKYTESEPERLYHEGERRLKNDDLDGAIDAFLQATYFARNGYYPEAYYWLGIAYMGKGNQDNKAIEALEKAVAQAVEEDTEALIAIAEI